MSYDKQIVQVLLVAGDRGISIRSLVKHVYNLNCTLFSQPDLEEVKDYVRKFIQRNSKSAKSLVARTGRRGYYRLNTRNNADARQMVMNFHKDAVSATDEQKEDKPQPDLSLSLFD